MSESRRAHDETLVEPSWTTALSEAEAALRRLRQATTSTERLSRELATLEEWSDTTARLELADALTDGPDGGLLNVLVTAASDQEAEPALRRTAGGLLDRIVSALGLEAVGERGEFLRLLPEQLAEFEVRGASAGPGGGQRELYCVVRPGWCVEQLIVARPLLELVRPSAQPGEGAREPANAPSSAMPVNPEVP